MLPGRDGVMRYAGFGGNVLGCLRQIAPAQRPQQVPGEDHVLPAPLGQSLFFKEISALLQGLLGIAAKAQIAQPSAAADQLLVEPLVEPSGLITRPCHPT